MEERRGEERVKVSVRSREVRVGLTGVRRWRVLVTWGPCSPYSERRRFHEWRGGIDVAACLPACLDHLQCLRPGYLVCSRGHTAHRCALTEPPWESSSYFQCWRSLTSGCGPGRTGVTGPANRVAARWAARPPHWPPPLPTTGRLSFLPSEEVHRPKPWLNYPAAAAKAMRPLAPATVHLCRFAFCLSSLSL